MALQFDDLIPKRDKKSVMPKSIGMDFSDLIPNRVPSTTGTTTGLATPEQEQRWSQTPAAKLQQSMLAQQQPQRKPIIEQPYDIQGYTARGGMKAYSPIGEKYLKPAVEMGISALRKTGQAIEFPFVGLGGITNLIAGEGLQKAAEDIKNRKVTGEVINSILARKLEQSGGDYNQATPWITATASMIPDIMEMWSVNKIYRGLSNLAKYKLLKTSVSSAVDKMGKAGYVDDVVKVKADVLSKVDDTLKAYTQQTTIPKEVSRLGKVLTTKVQPLSVLSQPTIKGITPKLLTAPIPKAPTGMGLAPKPTPTAPQVPVLGEKVGSARVITPKPRTGYSLPEEIKNVYHETSPSSIRNLLSYGDHSGLNVATAPEYAIGQTGKGVKFEFNATNLEGVPIKKPASGFLGDFEYKLIKGGFEPKDIKSITLAQGIKLDKITNAIFNRMIKTGEISHTKLPNGSDKFIFGQPTPKPVTALGKKPSLKPKSLGSALPTQRGAVGKGEFQNRVIAAQDFAKTAREQNYRIPINSDGSITIYHGTSAETAQKINTTGKIESQSFFSPNQKGAEFYGKTKNKAGQILPIKVDARSVEYSTGTGEIYAPNGLIKGNDGIWRATSQAIGKVGENPLIEEARIVQRIEEPGMSISFNKPQGLYTTPASVKSPHLDLGGKKTKFIIKSNAKEVIVDTSGLSKTPTVRGVDQMATNLVWLRKNNPNIVNSIRGKSVSELKLMFSKEFPKAEWNKYTEIQDMIEGYAGLKARQQGIDIIRGINKLSPEFSEVVILNKNVVSQATSQGVKPSKDVPSILKSERGALGVPKKILTPSEQYAQEQIAKREAARKVETLGITGKAINLYKEAKSKLVDFSAPIEDVLRTAQKKGKYQITPEYDITNQIDRVLRAPTIAGQFARDNGIEKVIQQVNNLDNLDQYLIAKQAKTVAARGIETGRDLVKDEQLINDFAPQYEPYAKVVNDYSRKLLDYSVESGLISNDLATTLKERYPNYVPLNRIFNELERTGAFGTKAVASISKQTIVQKLEGSEREIENPLSSLLSKTNDAFKQGEKNKAARILATYKDLPGNPFQLKELAEGDTAPFTVSFIDNGIKRTFETTQEIANAAKSLNVQHLNILGQIFAFPVRVARIGITGINLPFIAANVAKDQVTAIINSKEALKTSIANPAIFTKSLFEAVGHGKVYEEMGRQGLLGTSFDIARNQPDLALEKIRAGRDLRGKIGYTVRNPKEFLRAIENIVNRGEELTRIQQYQGTKQALIEKGMSEQRATIGASRASRENTVNFARRGEWGTVLNSTFLYINANIQGTRTFLRNFRDRPGQTAAKIAIAVFAPIAVATAWNLSDDKRREAYQDISNYEKENNIIIIPPNPVYDKDTNTWNIIKIPLSQEINNLAGMARRPIEQAYGLNPVVAKDIVNAFVGTVSPIAPTAGSFLSTLTPQAIKPTIEAFANKNFFTGKPTVPYSMEKLSPELQAKKYTAGTARQIGKVLKVSPLKVESWIRGTFGGIGSQVVNASDHVLAKLDIIPKDQIRGQNVIKAILARFIQARGGNLDNESNKKLEKIIQSQADDKFRLKQEAEILYTELKDLSPDESNAKAREIKKVNPQLFDKLKDTAINQKKGLDYNDRLMLQLGVETGQRAKFIFENVKDIADRKAKNEYIRELRKKKIVTDKVIRQLKFLNKSSPR